MRPPGQKLASWGVLVLALTVAGCATDSPGNPSFPLRAGDARADLRRMRKQPVALARPVVVLGGFLDPGFVSGPLTADFRRWLGDERVVGVGFLTETDFEGCRRRVIDAVRRDFPNNDPRETAEVDVVAVSMGGLVARYAAAPPANPAGASDAPPLPRLRIVRLFTISSPHRGAVAADRFPAWQRLHADMRPGSAFLRGLDEAWAARDYELYPYARLHDGIVGEANTAPEGRTAWWVGGPKWGEGHFGVERDPRILDDILLRLRGERPWTTEPAAGLPE